MNAGACREHAAVSDDISPRAPRTSLPHFIVISLRFTSYRLYTRHLVRKASSVFSATDKLIHDLENVRRSNIEGGCAYL